MTQNENSYPVVEAMKAGGGWNPLWDGLNEMDPEWTELYMKMAMQPYRSGVLSRKVIQLLCSPSTPPPPTCTRRAPDATSRPPWTWG